MKSEIKFTGKRIDNGKEITGFLCQNFNGGYSIMPKPFFAMDISANEDEDRNLEMEDETPFQGLAIGGWFDVIPESIIPELSQPEQHSETTSAEDFRFTHGKPDHKTSAKAFKCFYSASEVERLMDLYSFQQNHSLHSEIASLKSEVEKAKELIELAKGLLDDNISLIKGDPIHNSFTSFLNEGKK